MKASLPTESSRLHCVRDVTAFVDLLETGLLIPDDAEVNAPERVLACWRRVSD